MNTKKLAKILRLPYFEIYHLSNFKQKTSQGGSYKKKLWFDMINNVPCNDVSFCIKNVK